MCFHKVIGKQVSESLERRFEGVTSGYGLAGLCVGTGRNYEEAVMGLRGWVRVRCKVHFQATMEISTADLLPGLGKGGRAANKPTKSTRGRRSNPAKPRNRGPILNYHPPKKGRKPINERGSCRGSTLQASIQPFLPSRLLSPCNGLPCLLSHFPAWLPSTRDISCVMSRSTSEEGGDDHKPYPSYYGLNRQFHDH